MRKALLWVSLFIFGGSVGWLVADARPSAVGTPLANTVDSDPHWQPGQRVKVGYADPVGDVYRSDEVEIVRIVQLDGPTLETADGPTNGPRVEWKFHFPGRTYFAVPR